MVKNLSILILERFFLDLASLGEVRKSISRSISFSLIIIDLKVVSKELLGSMDLEKAQAFYIHKLIDVIIVSKDKDLIFAAF